MLIRAFIAIELPPELKKELTELETLLKKNSPPVIKWVDPDSIHITLKFLGDTSDAIIDKLSLAMAESVVCISPFELATHQLGSFPSIVRPQVIWVGVNGEMDKLARLRDNIEKNTEALRLVNAWQSDLLPQRQRDLVEAQLHKYRAGARIDVFDVFVQSVRALPQLSAGMSLLEIGCSSGFYSEVLHIAGLGLTYTGCDYSDAFIQLAREKYPTIAFDVEDATALRLVLSSRPLRLRL